MRVPMAFLMTALALAGCLADDDGPEDRDMQDDAALIGTPIVLDHDHNDATQHLAHHNLEQVGWSTLGITLGDNGFANFVLWSDDDERLAFVAIDGDDDGGFVIADVSDPADIRVLGTYWVPGNGIQEVRVTPDGRWAVLNVQDTPDPADVAGAGLAACRVCIHVVNVQDRSAPVLSSVTPVELLGTHNMDFVEQGGTLYLYYVGQPLGVSQQADPGNHVWIAGFLDLGTQAVLTPVSQIAHDTSADGGRSFPHDVLVQTHPVTGQDVAYVSHWEGGVVTFDVTDPLLPVALGVAADPAPSEVLAIHWTWQEEWIRPDGRVIVWSAPEIGTLASGTGVMRAYDGTDPADLRQIGTWTLPGELSIESRYILSPHTITVDGATGLAAVAHYHAGVWVLDVSDPEHPQHVAFYQPHGDEDDPYLGPLWWKKPNFSPDGYGPNVFQVRWDARDDGTLLWASDRGTGLYALEYTGPVPGPVHA